MKTEGVYYILRVGLGLTFLWIAVLIFRDPKFWGGFLQPWAAGLLPLPLTEAMIGTAVLDALIGLAFLVDRWVWVTALLGSIHLVVVLATTGITEVTVRDIGLLGGTIALCWTNIPEKLKFLLKKKSGGSF